MPVVTFADAKAKIQDMLERSKTRLKSENVTHREKWQVREEVLYGVMTILNRVEEDLCQS